MAIRKIKATAIEKQLGIDDKIERFKLGAIGTSGVDKFDGVPQSELVSELKYPRCLDTFRKMLMHPAINSSNNLHKSMVGKARFRFLPPTTATEQEKQQTLNTEQMFGDMEHTLEDSIKSAMTMIDWGFAPVEIVWRQRTKSSGSMYDDGLLGIRRLSLRHQQSIVKPVWDANDSEKMTGLVQDPTVISNNYYKYVASNKRKTIPIKHKLLMFKTGDDSSQPFGTCPLRNAYLPWRYLQSVEELEASGVAKDLQGLPVLYIPHEFMKADATPEHKAFYTYTQNLVRNVQMGNQSGIVLPSIIDESSKQPLLKLDLLSSDGKKNYQTGDIKQYYLTLIHIALSSDVLMQGNSTVGSFGLGSLKNSMTAIAVENYLKHIVSVFNDQLIRSIYELNGWDVSRMCHIDYEGFEQADLATFSQAIQRVSSVGLLPKTVDVVNAIMRTLGIDALPADTTQEELDAVLSEATSRSGDGMVTAFDGTGTSLESGVGNDNANNLANAA